MKTVGLLSLFVLGAARWDGMLIASALTRRTCKTILQAGVSFQTGLSALGGKKGKMVGDTGTQALPQATLKRKLLTNTVLLVAFGSV